MTADGRPVNGMRPIVDEEPPTGVHSLNADARRETRRDLQVTGGGAAGEPPNGVRLPHAG